MKHRLAVLLIAVIVSLLINQTVSAQSNQVVNSVKLSYLNVQFTYPAQALPGQTVTVDVQARAISGIQLALLTVQVYLADSNNGRLQQLTTATIAQSISMTSGNQIHRAIQVNIPADAPRASLVAMVSESISTLYYEPGNASPSVKPSISYYLTSSDNGIAPLTYVMAATTEYAALQSQYQGLQTQNQQLRRGINQSLAQNVKLQQSQQVAQSTIAELTSQLKSSQNMVTVLEAISAILSIAFVALAIVCALRQARQGKKSN
jgi:hypothetical protein